MGDPTSQLQIATNVCREPAALIRAQQADAPRGSMNRRDRTAPGPGIGAGNDRTGRKLRPGMPPLR